MVLLGDGQAMSAAFAGTSTDARFSDLTDEVSGTGYTAGGVALANVTWARASAIVTNRMAGDSDRFYIYKPVEK